MTSFDEFLAERKLDPTFKEEYDSLRAEFAVIQAVVDPKKKLVIIPKKIAKWAFRRTKRRK